MTKAAKYLGILAIAFTQVACGGEEATPDTTPDVQPADTTATAPVVEEVTPDAPVATGPDYEKDFEGFKAALLSQDIQGVSAYAGSDEIDAENIVIAFNDPDFLAQVKAATLADLTEAEGQEGVFELAVMVSGSDDEGNEWESGLFLYFSKGEDGLKLENFFAAG
jgi:hypothetical protein